jgi:hypothetical protein
MFILSSRPHGALRKTFAVSRRKAFDRRRIVPRSDIVGVDSTVMKSTSTLASLVTIAPPSIPETGEVPMAGGTDGWYVA